MGGEEIQKPNFHQRTMITALLSIDLKTLIWLTALLFTIKGAFLIFICQIRHQIFLKWLAWGCLFFALGWFLFFFRFEYGINLITLPLANIFILLMPVCLIVSIFSFLRIPRPKIYFPITLSILGFTFLFLADKMHSKFIPGLYSSSINAFFYIVAGFLLIKLAHPKKPIIWTIITLNFLMALVLLTRSVLLTLGWLYPGLISDILSTKLLTIALAFNLLCIDAQILCFPILDFMAAQHDLTIANQKLEELSYRDELTGLLNRRSLKPKLDQEIEKYRIDNIPLSIILFDLDHFKKINDNFGHPVGDIVLRETAKLVRYLVRPTDFVFRYGGEEFVVLLPETPHTEAFNIAEHLRREVSRLCFCDSEIHNNLQVTASFGIGFLNAEVQSFNLLLQKADMALYKAKQKGRNQVCF